MDDQSRAIGQRVSYWRARRDLTRQQLADLVGRSASWLVKVERGERSLVRLPMLERVAEALRIDIRVLVDAKRSTQATYCPDSTEVDAVKAALGNYGFLIQPAPGNDEPSVEALRKQTDYACMAWLNSHFTQVTKTLPGLIHEAQYLARELSGEKRAEATQQLVMIYRLASSMLIKFQARDAAWIAADRAMSVASASEDVVSLARASRSVARAMTEAGNRLQAIEVLTNMADKMQPCLGSNVELLSMYGMLLLPAEIAAAKRGDRVLASAMHVEAKGIAEQLEPSYTNRITAFGRTNVALHRVAALVRLHEGKSALMFASEISPSEIARLPIERRANFLMDIANARLQSDFPDQAVHVLLQAEKIAPQEVRCRPSMHEFLALLITKTSSNSTNDLRGLAERAGVSI
ncbi:MAG: helix-turn-helix domain-containing protein [Terriglobales bacterium]